MTLDKGSPVDVKFINELSTRVDKLEAASNSSPYQQTTITTGLFDQPGMKVVKTAETRIHAETKALPSATYNAGTTRQFSISLTNFAETPVATVNPIVVNPSGNAIAVTVVVTSVSKSSINGYVYFITNVPASITVGVSVVAVGIPSNSPGTTGTNIATNRFFTTPPQVVSN